MTATATPTIYDPKVLFQGALSTTLTTTLYTAPAEAGVRITTITVTNTGTTPRLVTIDYFKATTGRKILAAATSASDGFPMIVSFGPEGLIIDASDLIRGGQDVGTDVDVVISGWEMKD